MLDEPTFARFAALRAIRKRLAEADAVPAFAVFTDAELTEMVKMPELTVKGLLFINGIGGKTPNCLCGDKHKQIKSFKFRTSLGM